MAFIVKGEVGISEGVKEATIAEWLMDLEIRRLLVTSAKSVSS